MKNEEFVIYSDSGSRRECVVSGVQVAAKIRGIFREWMASEDTEFLAEYVGPWATTEQQEMLEGGDEVHLDDVCYEVVAANFAALCAHWADENLRVQRSCHAQGGWQFDTRKGACLHYSSAKALESLQIRSKK